MNFIKIFFIKTIAKQLRKPSGLLAGKVGDQMNISNSFLYDFTIHTMQLNNHDSILEIGFGNGNFFHKIFSAANNLNVSGLDFSPKMVESATKKNRTTIDEGKLTLKLGNSDTIPFPDNSFDKIFCINVIYFWEHPAVHLKEIYRVLKPAGKFYTSIRSKESIVQMPFAKYGFHIYSQHDWISLLQASNLRFAHTQTTQHEPDAVFDKQRFKVTSWCIVAEK